LARARAKRFRRRSVAPDDAPAPFQSPFTVFVGCTRGVEVAWWTSVADKTPENDRRGSDRGDRRKNSRSGRRATDPHVNWRRLTWLFAGYALYL